MLEYKLGAYNHLFSCKPLKQNLTLASATFTSPIIHIYHTLPTFHHAIIYTCFPFNAFSPTPQNSYQFISLINFSYLFQVMGNMLLICLLYTISVWILPFLRLNWQEIALIEKQRLLLRRHNLLPGGGGWVKTSINSNTTLNTPNTSQNKDRSLQLCISNH